jgi:phage terminase large subunit-like protein
MIDDLDLSREQKEQLLALLKEQDNRVKYNYISTLWLDDEEAITLPDCTKSLARTNYPKHLEFFTAGANFTERAFIAGNRCGKTLTGLCELYYHCSGKYPEWWEGKRFNKPVVCWLAGDRGEIIRDGMQPLLLGHTEFGTGIIPLEDFADEPDAMPGVPGGKGQYYIKHISGGVSKIIIKTYQAGKNAFESAAVDVVMLDEECPLDIYVETQMRTATTGGCVYLTFTPDSGLTDTVLHFLDRAKPGEAKRFVSMVGWDDVPHLAEKVKTALLATIPPHLRDVKTKGVPYLGAGAIYPIPEDEFLVKPFKIPEYWPKAYGMDVGWNKTAAVWGAYEEATDCWYLYSEYYRGQAEPVVHASGIQAKGSWINGVIDPSAAGGGKGKDGIAFLQAYEELGLNLSLANNTVDLGLSEVYNRLSTGRLKVFNSLQNWLFEYRIYRRNDKGAIVKENDHIMDATRYLMMSGPSVMSVRVSEDEYNNKKRSIFIDNDRSSITGY